MNYLCIFKMSRQKNDLSRRKQIFRIMRISTFFLFFCALIASAEDVQSQKARVSMKHRNVQLETVLSDIENQTDYLFLYNSNQIDVSQNVSVNAKNTPVNEVLSEIFSDSPVNYVMEGTHIVLLAHNGDAKNATEAVTQQSITVTGKVTDNFGDPLPGVTVTIKGLQQGTATGANGDYSLSVPNENVTLVFSYIGFISKEEVVGNRRTINVTLTDDTRQLEEVVVIGYGTVKKANLTGAVGFVDNKQIENRAVVSATQALQGKVAGLSITTPSGAPGAQQRINIRGFTNFNTIAAPLIVIDGVQASEDALSSIEINDVENISFLKDAASVAIYGSSAPYGVVLVTTKKGHVGKPVITYNNNFGYSRPINMPHWRNSIEVAEMINHAAADAGRVVYGDDVLRRMRQYQAGTLEYTDPVTGLKYFNPETIPSTAADDWQNFHNGGNGNNDWFGIFLDKTSFSQRHNVSASGATENSNFYVGLGYTQQDGLLTIGKEDDKRYNTRINVSTNLTKWLTISARSSFSRESRDMPAEYGATNSVDYSNGLMHLFGGSAPNWQLKNPKINPDGSTSADGQYAEFGPGVIYAEGGRRKIIVDNISLTGEFVIKPLPGWEITGNYTYGGREYEKFNHQKTIQIQRPSGAFTPSARTANTNNLASRDWQKTRDYVINAFTSYEKQVGDHFFKGLIGFNQTLNTWVQMTGSRDYLLSDANPMIRLAYGSNINLNDNAWEYATRGGFGRFQYNFKEKYLLELNGRYDGTSKYTKENRMKFYPGGSVGWVVSRENFWEPLQSAVNMLKFRVSYASLGDQNSSGRYDFYPAMRNTLATSTNWVFAGGSREIYFQQPSSLVNYNVTWITQNTFDFGFDFGAFNNRLDLTFDWYRRHSKDCLAAGNEYPNLLGVGGASENVAEFENKGWEISVGWKDRKGGFGYGITFVMSDYKGKILKYPSQALNWYEGREMGEIWGFVTEGLIQTQAEADLCNQTQSDLLGSGFRIGDVHYKIFDGRNQLSKGRELIDDHGDLRIIGNNTPRYQYGLTLNADWKGFDAQVFLQGVGKRDVAYDEYEMFFWGINGWGEFQSTYFTVHDFWTPDNPNGYLPNPTMATPWRNTQRQSRYVQDASYLRIKNIQLGYSIPKRLTDKISFNRARIFVNGENLATFTNMIRIADPEIAGIQNLIPGDGSYGLKKYPLRRTWSFGVNVTF